MDLSSKIYIEGSGGGAAHIWILRKNVHVIYDKHTTLKPGGMPSGRIYEDSSLDAFGPKGRGLAFSNNNGYIALLHWFDVLRRQTDSYLDMFIFYTWLSP